MGDEKIFLNEVQSALNSLSTGEIITSFNNSQINQIKMALWAMREHVDGGAIEQSSIDASTSIVERSLDTMIDIINICPVTNNSIGAFARRFILIVYNWNKELNKSERIASLCTLLSNHCQLAYAVSELIEEAKIATQNLRAQRSFMVPAIELSSSYLESFKKG